MKNKESTFPATSDACISIIGTGSVGSTSQVIKGEMEIMGLAALPTTGDVAFHLLFFIIDFFSFEIL